MQIYGGVWLGVRWRKHPIKNLRAPPKFESDVENSHQWIGMATRPPRRGKQTRGRQQSSFLWKSQRSITSATYFKNSSLRMSTMGIVFPSPSQKPPRSLTFSLRQWTSKKQNTIEEHGRIVKKDRLTHNQSFKWSSGTSVNNRTQGNGLLPCMFGAYIRQIVNWAVTAWQKFPNVRILASKFGFKSAFQRCHLNAATAVQTCTQLVEIGLLLMMLIRMSWWFLSG